MISPHTCKHYFRIGRFVKRKKAILQSSLRVCQQTVEQLCIYACVFQRGGVDLPQRTLEFKSRVRESDDIEKTGGTALRCSVILHIALGRMST